MIDINHFLEEATGLSGDEAKNVIVASAIEYDLIKNNTKQLLSRTTDRAEFRLIKNGEFIDIQLIFKDEQNIDYRVFLNSLIKYRDKLNVFMDGDMIPIHSLWIMPKIYDGKYYLSCINPLCWGIQPASMGSKKVVIQFIYRLDAVELIESTDEDIQKVKDTIAQEEKTNQSYEAKLQSDIEALEREIDSLEQKQAFDEEQERIREEKGEYSEGNSDIGIL